MPMKMSGLTIHKKVWPLLASPQANSVSCYAIMTVMLPKFAKTTEFGLFEPNHSRHSISSFHRLDKRGYAMPYLRCLKPDEADYVMREIHEGVCRNHSGKKSSAQKALRQGFY